MCLCSTVRDLAEIFDESRATQLASDLNKHLAAIRSLLSKSKSLTRDVHWQLIPSNQRTRKILSVQSVDTSRVDRIYDGFRHDTDGFWSPSEDPAHAEIRRRIACMTVFLRSILDPEAWVSPGISALVQGSKVSELRFAGKKYIKIARRLGGVGSVVWLPLDVPSSTYERYLNMDDDEVFTHLQAIGLGAPNYDDFVRRLISSQLNDSSLKLSYHNLAIEHGDVLPSSDQILLLISALGGVQVPVQLLKSVRDIQRRWTDDGEIQAITATEFGLPPHLVKLLSDDNCLAEVDARREITTDALEDGTPTWSIRPESRASFTTVLSPQSQEALAGISLRLICFASPPCYEGKANWSRHLKSALWVLLDNATKQQQHTPLPLRKSVIETLLFFSERDLFAIRRLAIERARLFLHKCMPYYFHASVALFESNILRINGDLDKSDAVIHEFARQGHHGSTRCDNALRGRLHISHMENKIARYDKDVASHMYRWEGTLPLSTFEIEVTRRLQGTAAKFFQSIGDFQTARASLEQHLWLNATKPIRPNTRALIVCKLSEIHCELDEFEKAIHLLESEMESIPEPRRRERPFRRLSLALAEANMGLGRLDAAESVLRLLAGIEPPELDDINDQVLHMRRLMDTARAAHERLRFGEALALWGLALDKMEQQLAIFRSRHKWTAAIVRLSIAHAQLSTGDRDGGRRSWDIAVEISRCERCEYAIPGLATTWLRKMVGAIHRQEGWPFRVMLPRGRPDITWP